MKDTIIFYIKRDVTVGGLQKATWHYTSQGLRCSVQLYRHIINIYTKDKILYTRAPFYNIFYTIVLLRCRSLLLTHQTSQYHNSLARAGVSRGVQWPPGSPSAYIQRVKMNKKKKS